MVPQTPRIYASASSSRPFEQPLQSVVDLPFPQAEFEELVDSREFEELQELIKNVEKPVKLLQKQAFFKKPVKGTLAEKERIRKAKILTVVKLLGPSVKMDEIFVITGIRTGALNLVFPEGIPGRGPKVVSRQLTPEEWAIALGTVALAALDSLRIGLMDQKLTIEDVKKHPIFAFQRSNESVNYLPKTDNLFIRSTMALEKRKTILAILAHIYLFGPSTRSQVYQFCNITDHKVKEALKLVPGLIEKNILPASEIVTNEQRFEYMNKEIINYMLSKDTIPTLEDVCEHFNMSPTYVEAALNYAYDYEDPEFDFSDSASFKSMDNKVRTVSIIALNKMLNILKAHNVNITNGVVCEGQCGIKSNRFYEIESVLEIDHVFGPQYNDPKHLRVLCGCCHSQTLNCALEQKLWARLPNYVTMPDLVSSINYSALNMALPNSNPPQGNFAQSITSARVRGIQNLLLKRKYDNFQCENCGVKTWRGNSIVSALEIHHKDGCHQNNDENNLLVVCRNCHNAFHFVNATQFNKQTQNYENQTGPVSRTNYLTANINIPVLRLVAAVMDNPARPLTVVECARLIGITEDLFQRLGESFYPNDVLFQSGRNVNQKSLLPYEARVKYPYGLTFNDLKVPTEDEIKDRFFGVTNSAFLDSIEALQNYYKRLQNSVSERFSSEIPEFN